MREGDGGIAGIKTVRLSVVMTAPACGMKCGDGLLEAFNVIVTRVLFAADIDGFPVVITAELHFFNRWAAQSHAGQRACWQ